MTNRAGRQSAEVAEQTKQQILDAALECFANQGFRSTSLRDIAEKAGTTHGLPRHHFGSKEDLWKACAASVVQQVAELQAPALESVTEETALESLKHIARVFIRSAAAYPNFWRLVAFESLKGSDRLNYLLALALPQHARVAEVFEMVQAQGHLEKFDNSTFFLFLVSAGAMPFAMSPLSSFLYAGDIQSEDARTRHEDLVLSVLFGD